MSSYPKAQEYLPVLACSFKSLFKSETNANEQVEKVFSTCAARNGVNYEPIEACYHSEKIDVEFQSEASSVHTPVNVNCNPHVEVNEKRIDITKCSLIEEICNAIDSDVSPRHYNKNNIRRRR